MKNDMPAHIAARNTLKEAIMTEDFVSFVVRKSKNQIGGVTIFRYTSGKASDPDKGFSKDVVGQFNDKYFWLLDGATPPNGKPDLTKLFVDFLDENLRQLVNDEQSLPEIVKAVIRKTREDFTQTHFSVYISDPCSEYMPSATMILVRLNEDSVDYFVLGRSFLCINDLVITDKRLDLVGAESKQRLAKLYEQDVPRNDMRCVIERNKIFEEERLKKNRNGGYWTIAMEPEAADHARVGSIATGKVTRVFALSDGLERLVSGFGLYENIPDLANRTELDGSDAVFSDLRALEDARIPLHPLASLHDDASYFLFRRYIEAVREEEQ